MYAATTVLLIYLLLMNPPSVRLYTHMYVYEMRFVATQFVATRLVVMRFVVMFCGDVFCSYVFCNYMRLIAVTLR